MLTLPIARVTPLRGGPVLRWGLLAPGEIANDFVATLHANTDQRMVAVASRTPARAEAFASKHGIPRHYGSYQQLVDDPEVDVVYVAAPHSEHRTLALLAINAGKHVLIEKPIALDAGQAREIAEAARAAGVFAMEAMWSRYLPQADVIRQLLADGALGEVRLVTADAGWHIPFDSESRFFDPDLGGGAALDAGVYALWFAQFVLGHPTTVRAVGSLAPTGVDDQAAIVMTAASGAQAAITTSVTVATPGHASIVGTEGSLRFESSFLFPASFRVIRNSDEHGSEEIFYSDDTGLEAREGLAWQATALAGYVAAGLTESPLHSLDDSIALMETIDQVRKQVGVAARKL